MATASVTHALTNGTTADATKVMTNFNDLVGFLNTNVVHKDGSVAMSGMLTLTSTTPSSSNHATSKKYVDDGRDKVITSLPGGASPIIYNSGDTIATVNIPDQGFNINVWVVGMVLGRATGGGINYWALEAYVDGGRVGGTFVPHVDNTKQQSYPAFGIPTQHNAGSACTVALKVGLAAGTGQFELQANTGANNIFTVWYTRAF